MPLAIDDLLAGAALSKVLNGAGAVTRFLRATPA
jgi:hypothetical protein